MGGRISRDTPRLSLLYPFQVLREQNNPEIVLEYWPNIGALVPPETLPRRKDWDGLCS